MRFAVLPLHIAHLPVVALLLAVVGSAAPGRLRIGYGSSAPITYQDREGRPRGFAVDVLNEAARREKIQVEWVLLTEAADAALRAGRIDLIPAGVIHKERQREFLVSEPWWSFELVALSRAGSGVERERDLAGRRLAVPAAAVASSREHYRGEILAVGSAGEAAARVCDGRADAAIIAGMYLRELLAGMPAPCRGVGLRTIDLSAQIEFGLVARRDGRREAERLRERIDEITRDGTLLRLSLANPPVSTPQAARLSESHRSEYVYRVTRMGLGAMGALLLITAIFVFRQHRSQRQLNASNRQLQESMAERERAMSALHESEERFRSLVETAFDCVWEVDREGRHTFISPRVEELAGYTPEEVLGRTPFDFMPEEDVERARALFGHLLKGHKAFSALKSRLRHKDGRILVLESSGTPVFDPGGEFRGYRGMNRDITERERAEEERMRLEAQVSQAQRMESIGRLAGGVAHDFNNLLTVINGYTSLALVQRPEGARLRGYLEAVNQAGERAAGLTRQLLAFSRKQMMQPRVLRLNGVIEEMHKMTARLVGEDVEVHLQLSREDPVVHADPVQLEQVIMNLAVNARDAMPQGGRLWIETGIAERAESGAKGNPEGRLARYAVLTVSDTGVGMDEATQKRIFEPFFTTKPIGEGTGLGLSMVQGIVEQSGGQIEVLSSVGQGTAFRIYLPAAAGRSGGEEGRGPTQTLEGEGTVLVVEDQSEVRQFAVHVLTSSGYRVLEAPTADEALEIFEREGERIDLLLTDVIMPQMSGRELAGRITRLRANVAVLFMSGYTEDVIARHGILDPDVAVILKPFRPEELAGKVSQVLAARRAAARILVLDEDSRVRTYLRVVLEGAGYEVRESDGGEAAGAPFGRESADLVIAALAAGGQEGAGTIEAARKQNARARMIALSAGFGGSVPELRQRLGVEAIVGKPVNPDELLAAVEQVLGKARS